MLPRSPCGLLNVTVTVVEQLSPAKLRHPSATTITPDRRLPTVLPIVRRFGRGGAAVICVVSLLAPFELSGSPVAAEATGRAVIVPCWPRPVRTATSIPALAPAASESASQLT